MSKKLRYIEKIRKSLDGATKEVGKRSYDLDDINFYDFKGWGEAAAEVKDIDLARTVLYFGFQPLYDLLIDNSPSKRKFWKDSRRNTAIETLDSIISQGTQYLAGYYIGNPDIRIINELGISTLENMGELNDLPFITKSRNVDHNGITPQNIVKFLQQFLDNTLDGKSLPPEFVVGVACGPSEIAMPLAYLSGTELGFMRRSYRRGDDAPKIIAEHKNHLKKNISGKDVVVFEDYVCTGESLRKVMVKTKSFHPKSLIGTSINISGSPNMNKIVSRHKFQSYEL